MASWVHDPFLNYNANLLKQAGTEQYTSGRETTAKGLATLDPSEQYFRRLLSGDQQQIMTAIAPEVDAISNNFNMIRQMISDLPRGGGKTSVLAQLPIEQSRQVTNTFAQARREAPLGLERIAGQRIGAGLSETGQGIGAAGSAAGIALGGREQDIAQSWKKFFQQFLISGAQGAGAAAANLLVGGGD